MICFRCRPVSPLLAAAILAIAPGAVTAQTEVRQDASEDVYLLRSIRESQPVGAEWCTPERTGFDPFQADAERSFSFWSLQSRQEDGKVTDAQARRVAALRGCFGPTGERTRQNFYAEIQLGTLLVQGRGECLAVGLDFPEEGLFPVRCQLVLGKAAPYVGGLLTTNTLTSKAPFGGIIDPPGYVQASIATIRLWKDRPSTVQQP
jgi:hypothetical protein